MWSSWIFSVQFTRQKSLQIYEPTFQGGNRVRFDTYVYFFNHGLQEIMKIGSTVDENINENVIFLG